MDQIGATAGQLSQQGLYWILSAVILLLAAILLGFATGKFLFAREQEATKEQLQVANTLLANAIADNEETEKLRAANEKTVEELRGIKETLTRLNERQEQYDRERWINNRSAGGGGGSA